MEQIPFMQKMRRQEHEQGSKLKSYSPYQRTRSMQFTSEFRKKLGQIWIDWEKAAHADKTIVPELDEYRKHAIAIITFYIDTNSDLKYTRIDVISE